MTESEKMRKAAEAQATSAAAQAAMAQETLQHLRQQVEDLSGLGKSIVRSTIDSIVRSIEDWKNLDIKSNLATAQSFPSPGGLIPESAQSAVEHARRVSDNCVNLLTSAFDDLRSAQYHIEMLRKGSDTGSRGYSHLPQEV